MAFKKAIKYVHKCMQSTEMNIGNRKWQYRALTFVNNIEVGRSQCLALKNPNRPFSFSNVSLRWLFLFLLFTLPMHQGHGKGVFAPWVQPSMHLIVFKLPPRCHSVLKLLAPSTSNFCPFIWSHIMLLIHVIWSNINISTSCVSLRTSKATNHHMSYFDWTTNVVLFLSMV